MSQRMLLPEHWPIVGMMMTTFPQLPQRRALEKELLSSMLENTTAAMMYLRNCGTELVIHREASFTAFCSVQWGCITCLTRMQRLRLTGSLKQFAESSSSLLEFVYNTQLEHAACAGDTCVTMDGSEQSYELLGNYGAGKVLYQLVTDVDGRLYLQFCPQGEGAVDSVDYPNMVPQRVALPYLQASEADLRSYS
eukprot:jgi/Mesen1/7988/ME000425S07192